MASMTYLLLSQYTHRLMRAGNATSGSQPAAIPIPTQQDQIVYDIVDTIPRAWEWIQNQHPSWDFMRKQGTFTLTSGTRTYSLATIQVAIPDYYGFIPFFAGSDNPYYYLYDSGSATPQYFTYRFVEYIAWRGLFDRLPRPANFQPTNMTERPDKTLEFDPAPNLAGSGANWAIKFDYRIKNQVLTLASDVPILPPEFHEMIAWVAAMMLLETRQNVNLTYATAKARVDNYMDKLTARYLPRIQVDFAYA